MQTTPSAKASLLDRPIFIVGSGRSGTTLLRSLLSAHPRISITPETHFMKRAEMEGASRQLSPAAFEAFWDWYTSWVRFKDLGVDPSRCRALIDEQGDRTFRSIFQAVLAAYGERVGAERVGEKSPSHVFFLPRLLEWFPDAQMLITQRDPRAVVASQLQTPWAKDRLTPFSLQHGFFLGKRPYEVAHLAHGWTTIYEDIVPAWQRDPRVFVVPYEALVKDVEGMLRAICDFLGESYEPEMLTARTRDTVPPPAGTAKTRLEEWRREHHDQSLRPVSSASLEKWKDRLAEKEVAMIEGHCAEGMRAAGYAPSAPAPQRLVGGAFSKAVFGIGTTEKRGRTAARTMLDALPGARRRP